MEIFINTIGHQNLLDIVTRKYNELLYILAEYEKIYISLEGDIRADIDIQRKYKEILNKINGLVLELKRHRDFLSIVESEYLLTERLILKKTEELPVLDYNAPKPVASATKISSSIVQANATQYDLKTFPELDSFEQNFSYIPADVLKNVKYDVKEMTDFVQIVNFKDIEWEEDCIKRDYNTYLSAVTLVGFDQYRNPTKEEYMKSCFDKMNIEYPSDINNAFIEPAVMTNYGWYRTTRETAIEMTFEGYPVIVCNSSGVIGFVLQDKNKYKSDSSITAYCEKGMININIKEEPDIHFYIHR